ncbi:MAG: hypothetical protein N3E37_03840 [Candidatus Micrarchaeota archaeon]|nr:hypothetical protein [Candidatus Micrarchaeota archaeon]
MDFRKIAFDIYRGKYSITDLVMYFIVIFYAVNAFLILGIMLLLTGLEMVNKDLYKTYQNSATDIIGILSTNVFFAVSGFFLGILTYSVVNHVTYQNFLYHLDKNFEPNYFDWKLINKTLNNVTKILNANFSIKSNIISIFMKNNIEVAFGITHNVKNQSLKDLDKAFYVYLNFPEKTFKDEIVILDKEISISGNLNNLTFDYSSNLDLDFELLRENKVSALLVKESTIFLFIYGKNYSKLLDTVSKLVQQQKLNEIIDHVIQKLSK